MHYRFFALCEFKISPSDQLDSHQSSFSGIHYHCWLHMIISYIILLNGYKCINNSYSNNINAHTDPVFLLRSFASEPFLDSGKN